MKKRFAFVVTILLAVCFCMTIMSGCLMALHIGKDLRDSGGPIFSNPQERQDTLILADVAQRLDGNLTFKIKNEEVVSYYNRVEITLNHGLNWYEAEKDSKRDYYYRPQERYYGKVCEVAIRLAGDGEKKAGKKSNAISITVKKPSGFKSNISNEVLDALWGTEPKAGDYVFVAQGEKLVLKKHRFLQEQGLITDSLAKSEMLNFEYKIIDREVAIKEYKQIIEGVFKDFEINNDPNYSNLLDEMSVIYYGIVKGLKEDSNPQGWTLYDYESGILKDDYEKGIVWNLDFNQYSDDSNLMQKGNMVLILIREKGGSSKLDSEVALAGVVFE